MNMTLKNLRISESLHFLSAFDFVFGPVDLGYFYFSPALGGCWVISSADIHDLCLIPFFLLRVQAISQMSDLLMVASFNIDCTKPRINRVRTRI
ncbi:uncharacterized protein BO80DRAFT_191841 [Aspergillus ibericus CBS 121593]|uniref:Uncharacterized protein n=1 Tax=Aspergillus ibericus CBS 121593 TaxID=1448316 RepID=A0A395GTG7_9EURO|nr:hypothetical protein BO80DRAFT_191841 [Aspergillus ibericus CBS 121593]RAK97383.1 hypothetical protein BO80DRAFT_191841 [Aspergillus ibericus CBS 121593]